MAAIGGDSELSASARASVSSGAADAGETTGRLPAADGRAQAAVRLAGRVLVLAAAVVLLFSGLVKLLDIQAFAAVLASHGRLEALGLAGQPRADGPLPIGAASLVAWAETLAALGAVVLLAVGGSARGGLLRAWGRADAVAAGCVVAMWLALGGYAVWMAAAPPPVPVSCGCGVLGGVLGGVRGSEGPAEWGTIAARNLGVCAALAGAWGLASIGRPRGSSSARAVGDASGDQASEGNEAIASGRPA